MHRHCLLTVVLVVITAWSAVAEGAAAGKLAFRQAPGGLEFDTGALRGMLSGGGKSLGLFPVTHAASNAQVAGAFGILSPYRMLTSRERFGTAAWDWTCKAELLPDGAAQLRWSADKNHPFDMTGVYRWSSANTLDLVLKVRPRRDLPRFELFLASYFNGFPVSLAYVEPPGSTDGAGRFMAAVKPGGNWQTFPRDDAAMAIYTDGRWKHPPHPVVWTKMPRFATPLAVRRDAKTGLTAVLMSRSSDCFAVSMPYGEEGHRSVYFSLFGVDIRAAHDVSASVRCVIDRDISDAQAVELYREYVKRPQAVNPPTDPATPHGS